MRLAQVIQVVVVPILGSWLGCNAIIGLELGEPEEIGAIGSAGASASSQNTSGPGTSSGGAGSGSGGAGPGSGGAGGGVTESWWNPSWERRVHLTFDNAASPEPLLGFAVLVKLDAMRFDYASSPAGADLRFVDADGTTLIPYEIERWDVSGESSVWVRVPQIDAGSIVDSIWLYYGNAAPPAQNPGEVWSDTYAGVYHLSDNPFLGTIRDSTGAHDGVPQGSMNAADQVAGIAGGAIDFDGLDDYIALGTGNHVSAFDVEPGMERTVEAWLRTSGGGDRPVIAQEASCSGWSLMMLDDGTLQGRLFLDQNGFCPATHVYTPESPAAAYDDDQWHHVALVLDRPAATMRLHIDGARVTTEESIDNVVSGIGNYDRIGSNYTGMQGFKGVLDEVRISTVARSDAWIAAQYASMRDMFVSYGMTEQAP